MAKQKINTAQQRGTTLFRYSDNGSATSTTTQGTNSFPTPITFTLSEISDVEISWSTYVVMGSLGSRLNQWCKVTNISGAAYGAGTFNAPGSSTWGDQGNINARAVLLGLTPGSYTYVISDIVSSGTATTTFRNVIAKVLS